MDPLDLLPYAVAVFLNGACALSACGVLVRARRDGGRHRLLDRWDALARTANTFFFLVLALLLTSWALVPVLVWYLVLALTAASAAAVVLRWPELRARGADPGAASRRLSAIGTLVLLAFPAAALLVVV
ncbi:MULTISPECIES: hypothetical protein [unclassified Nocardiopsis]|uniref:hypothetical protein n=1 Tax=unclassified Nocardiopsis TaxID=2649073 RepID=UPI001357A3F6|nr:MULTISPECIES: hypothetical protein [unclassified Nocardiopsis]